MTLPELSTYRWEVDGSGPLIPHPSLSPIIADPAVVPPEDSPDGTWRLYAHSAWGIHEYRSADGTSWLDRGVVLRDAMRPWIARAEGRWCLLYERYRGLGLALSWIRARRWRSWIEMRRSDDLERWGLPAVLLEPSLPWHRREGLGEAVGNPCLVLEGGCYRLYYSASLVRVPDCGFNEPESIGIAESDRLEGPYVPRPRPLLAPEPGDRQANLSRGSLRLLSLEDGWAGFENGISLDAGTGRSGSAILLLGSRDGLRWEPLAPQPIVSPGDGWMRSHVYSGCPVIRDGGEIHLYFNARDDWKLSRGRERIGRAIGRPA